jgi:hypothetical protein
MSLHLAWSTIDQSPAFWGCIGGVSAAWLNYQEIGNLPLPARPDTSEFRYRVKWFGNAILGSMLAHLYAISGSPLNGLAAFITGASAPLLLKQMISAAVPQHVPGSREPSQTTKKGQR